MLALIALVSHQPIGTKFGPTPTCCVCVKCTMQANLSFKRRDHSLSTYTRILGDSDFGQKLRMLLSFYNQKNVG